MNGLFVWSDTVAAGMFALVANACVRDAEVKNLLSPLKPQSLLQSLNRW